MLRALTATASATPSLQPSIQSREVPSGSRASTASKRGGRAYGGLQGSRGPVTANLTADRWDGDGKVIRWRPQKSIMRVRLRKEARGT
jgi:hypothetical protein